MTYAEKFRSYFPHDFGSCVLKDIFDHSEFPYEYFDITEYCNSGDDCIDAWLREYQGEPAIYDKKITIGRIIEIFDEIETWSECAKR